MSESLIPSFLVSDVSESLRSLTKNVQCEQIAQRKWAIVSKLLRSLTKKKRMSELLVFFNESLIRSFLGKNEWFAQKTNERIPSPVFAAALSRLSAKSISGLFWYTANQSLGFSGTVANLWTILVQ